MSLLTQIPNSLPKVKVSADDSMAKYLADALVQGTGITLTTILVDDIQKIRISSSSGGGNMSTNIYDINGNGIVDEAEHIDGGTFED